MSSGAPPGFEPVSGPPPGFTASPAPTVPEGPPPGFSATDSTKQRAPSPVLTPHTYDPYIQTSAKKHGVDAAIIQQLGLQETQLGTGPNYNPKTGRDLDSNKGVGPWQVDPSSGTPQAVLDRIAKDPAFAADYVGGMIKNALAAENGDKRRAFARYHGGPQWEKNAAANLQYADQVLARTPQALQDTPPKIPSPPPGFSAPKTTGKGDHTLPGALSNPQSIAEHAFNVANEFLFNYEKKQVFGTTHALNSANEGGMEFLPIFGARAKESAHDPLGAALNIEQTLARFANTLVQHGVSGPTLGAAFYNALNPGIGDTDYVKSQKDIRHVTDPIISTLMTGLHPGISEQDMTKYQSTADPMLAALQNKTDFTPNPRVPFAQLSHDIIQGAEGMLSPAKAKEVVESWVAQSLADPVTMFPLVGWMTRTASATRTMRELGAAAKAAGGSKAAAPFMRAANALYQPYKKSMHYLTYPTTTRPELDPLLEAHSKGARLGFEHANILGVTPIRDHDTQLLTRYRDEINNINGTLSPDVHSLHQGAEGTAVDKLRLMLNNSPEEVRQRILAGMYKLGDQQTRHLSTRLGYAPTAEDIPITTMSKGELSLRDYTKILNRAVSPTRFQDIFGKTPSLGQRLEQYLFGESNQLWKNRADRATKDYLEKHGGWRGEGPIDVSKLTHGPEEAFGHWGLSGSPLRFLGKWGTQAVQGVPFAHAVNNVGTLTYLKSPIALGRAVGYMAKEPNEQKIMRLGRMGSFQEYTSDPGSVWTNMPGVGQALKVGQHTLSRMEIAYRQGLLDELDRTLGPSVDEHGNITNLRLEMQKGQEIRDAVVDYRNVPLVIAWMQAAGAPFAPFLGGLVKAVSHAAVHNPERVAHVMRGERNIQDQYGETFPNPVNTMAKLAFDPFHEIANHLGLVGSGFTKEGESDYPMQPVDIVSQMARSAGGPVASRGPAFFNEPYNAPGTTGPQFTPVQGLLNLLLGEYPYRPQSVKAIKMREREINRTRGEAASILPEK